MRVFRETQRFNQWWLWLIHIASFLFFIYAIYQWYFVDTNVGNVTSDDSVGQLVVIISVFSIFVLFNFLMLKTEIDERGIHYQFLPFHLSQKTIHWHEMEKSYVRTYKPITEYGGWGYRISFEGGKAFNVKGNKGIQIVFKTGKKLLIGTQKENEAQEIINRYLKSDYERI
jgi:hypothetical protein